VPFSWTNETTWSGRPIVVAHRGCSVAAPENTLAAFALAIDSGADAIELDVRCTADGKVVVIHDATLRRTTTGRGRIGAISYAAIKECSAGKGFGGRYKNEHVPLLTEVFDCILGQANPIGINIEIKESPRTTHTDVVEECLRIIRRYRAERIVMISSFHHPYIRRAKQREPRITTGVLRHGLRHLHPNPAGIAANAGASYFLCSKSALSRGLVQKVHEQDVRTGVYTVNNVRSLPRLVRAGVDLIFTDDPAKIGAALRKMHR